MVVGKLVVLAAVVGLKVTITVGRLVVGIAVVGTLVVGTLEVGAEVVGAAVVGTLVVGAEVVSGVIGGAVVGATVAMFHSPASTKAGAAVLMIPTLRSTTVDQSEDDDGETSEGRRLTARPGSRPLISSQSRPNS